MMIMPERNLIVIDLNEIGMNPRFTKHICLLPTIARAAKKRDYDTHPSIKYSQHTTKPPSCLGSGNVTPKIRQANLAVNLNRL